MPCWEKPITLSHNIYRSITTTSLFFCGGTDEKRISRNFAGCCLTFAVTLFIDGATRSSLDKISPFFAAASACCHFYRNPLRYYRAQLVISANESSFHAMAAKQVPAASQAIKLVKNADKVANFCNDLVGDIAGTLSGAIGAIVASSLGEPVLITLMAPFGVHPFTVGGRL